MVQHNDVKFFELDQANEQQQKRAALESAGIPCEHVSFVSIDFARVVQVRIGDEHQHLLRWYKGIKSRSSAQV